MKNQMLNTELKLNQIKEIALKNKRILMAIPSIISLVFILLYSATYNKNYAGILVYESTSNISKDILDNLIEAKGLGTIDLLEIRKNNAVRNLDIVEDGYIFSEATKKSCKKKYTNSYEINSNIDIINSDNFIKFKTINSNKRAIEQCLDLIEFDIQKSQIPIKKIRTEIKNEARKIAVFQTIMVTLFISLFMTFFIILAVENKKNNL